MLLARPSLSSTLQPLIAALSFASGTVGALLGAGPSGEERRQWGLAGYLLKCVVGCAGEAEEWVALLAWSARTAVRPDCCRLGTVSEVLSLASPPCGAHSRLSEVPLLLCWCSSGPNRSYPGPAVAVAAACSACSLPAPKRPNRSCTRRVQERPLLRGQWMFSSAGG